MQNIVSFLQFLLKKNQESYFLTEYFLAILDLVAQEFTFVSAGTLPWKGIWGVCLPSAEY